MASFHAEIDLKRPRKRENNNYRSVPTQCVTEKSKKIAKKLKRYHYGFISNQNRLEKAKKERK